MIRIHFIGVALILLLGTDPVAAQVLTRTKFNVGDCVLDQHTTIEDGNVRENADDKPVPYTGKATEVTLTTIESMNGTAVIQVFLETLANYELGEVSKGDDKVRQADNDPLEQLPLRYRDVDGIWKGELAEGDTPEDIRPLLEDYHPPTESSFLPDYAVNVGDRWTIDNRQLRRLIGTHAIKFNGKGDCEFVRVVDFRGRPHGLIQWQLELELTMLDENSREIVIKSGMTGQSWVDVESGIETKYQGRGTRITYAQSSKGEPYEVSGRIVVRGSTQLLTAKKK